ncbi:MAG: DUF2760 domain-containing protein [Desulfobacula sp.]|nr:DUF2760 domain-containing protein [Desulfobacula sp.]MBT6339725.1 DUF2760 domain-containing protein [Desulfobacula sp.]
MEVFKIYSRKSFGIITLFVLLPSMGINAGLYFGIDRLSEYLSKDVGNEMGGKTISWGLNHLELISQNFYIWVLPAVTGAFLLCGWLLWIVLKFSMGKTLVQVHDKTKSASSKGKSKKDFVDQKIEQDRKRRLFLHSLSILQRDGRLLDFFDEDLSLYNDEQIGATVRSIQEDCKKTIKKYIDVKPVLDAEEGETIKIEPGFDIDAIKLVGNVSGEPPFEGVLKHRGWKAGKKEIPKLSDIQDSGIIIPAEVEIQN